MEKVLEFFESLVVPKKMAKYRYMSVLVSIIIFMVSVYVISLPMTSHIKNSSAELKENYNFQALLEIENHLDEDSNNLAIMRSLANLGCSVSSGELECKNLQKDEVFEEEVVFTTNGITKKIKFVVDLKTEQPKSNDIIIDIKDTPYVDNEEVYLIILFKNAMYFQAHQNGINELERSHNNNQLRVENRFYGYDTYMKDFTLNYDEASARNIGSFITEAIVSADITSLTSQAFTYLFLIMFILPIIFIFIFWLFFRRNGVLKSYKEYYNIAAIASVVPIILTFILSWFFRSVVEYYMYAFSLFYLYILYRINSFPDEID